MRIITFLNEKGGVGKTTLAVHAATGLAIKGMRVLLLDMDPQAHATISLIDKKFGGLYRLLIQGGKWNDLLVEPDQSVWAGRHQPKGRLYLLPGNEETRGIPMVTDDTTMLLERLEDIASEVDVVCIDTSPHITMLHTMAYLATNELIYPSECEQLSLDGLGNSVKHVVKLNKVRKAYGNDPARLLGVVPMKYDAQTTAHTYGLKQIEDHFGYDRTWQGISDRTIWRDASYSHQSIFAYAPRSESAGEMWDVVNRLAKAVSHA